MKYITSEGRMSSPELQADWKNAEVFDKIRVGRIGVYFPSGLSVRHVPYSAADRVFIRIHEVNGKLCCGSAKFYYFRIVFVKDGEEFADYITENEELANAALKLIAERAPEINIGFVSSDVNKP